MGSGAGKVILPLVSLAAAPATGGASLAGLGSGLAGIGTGAALANAGIGLLRDRSRAKAEDAEMAAAMQSARTDRLVGQLSLEEKRAEAERRRARELAGIANSGRVGPRAKAGIAGAANRESQAVFSSLAGRQAALDANSRSRIAALRRKSRRDRTERAFGLFDDIQGLGRDLTQVFGGGSL